MYSVLVTQQWVKKTCFCLPRALRYKIYRKLGLWREIRDTKGVWNRGIWPAQGSQRWLSWKSGNWAEIWRKRLRGNMEGQRSFSKRKSQPCGRMGTWNWKKHQLAHSERRAGSHHRGSFFEASGSLVLMINTLGFHQMERECQGSFQHGQEHCFDDGSWDLNWIRREVKQREGWRERMEKTWTWCLHRIEMWL